MKNSYAGVEPVPMEEAIRRAGEYGAEPDVPDARLLLRGRDLARVPDEGSGIWRRGLPGPRGDAQAGEGRLEE